MTNAVCASCGAARVQTTPGWCVMCGTAYPPAGPPALAQVAAASPLSARQRAIRATATSAFLEAHLTALGQTGGGGDALTGMNLSQTLVMQPPAFTSSAEAAEAFRPVAEVVRVPPLPAKTAKLSAMGAGPMVAVASLLARIDPARETLKKCADSLKVGATRVRAEDANALHLRRAELLLQAGQLREADLRTLRVGVTVRADERERAGRLFRAYAANEWEHGHAPTARWASAKALEIANDGSEILTKTRNDEERLAAELAIGELDVATDLAGELARKRPDDLALMQRVAAALFKSAVVAEHTRSGGRQFRWDPALALWAAMVSHPPFWRAFAHRRAEAYGKQPDASQIEEAATNARDRVRKTITSFAELHKNENRPADAAELTRLGEAFEKELEAIAKVKQLKDGLTARGVTMPGPAIALGPLGMTLFGVRESVAAALQPFVNPNSKSPFDLAVADLVRQLGELAEGWSALSNAKYEDAARFARERLESRRGDDQAQRLVVAVLDAVVKARIRDAAGLEECLAWFGGAPLPRGAAAPLKEALTALAELRGAAQAKHVMRSHLTRLDATMAGSLEAAILLTEAIDFANRKEWGRAARLLVDAAAMSPGDHQIERVLDVVANSFAHDLLSASNPATARAAFEKLGGLDLKPIRASRAFLLAANAIELSNADREDEAEKLIREALRMLPPHNEQEKRMRNVLANVLLGQAAQLVRRGARVVAMQKLQESARLGSTQASEILAKINPWGIR